MLTIFNLTKVQKFSITVKTKMVNTKLKFLILSKCKHLRKKRTGIQSKHKTFARTVKVLPITLTILYKLF